MSMTLNDFLGHMRTDFPDSDAAAMSRARKMGEVMFKLAETDEGMKDLLDRATEYYLLKTEK